MKKIGFRYAATSFRGRDIRNLIWLPAILPAPLAQVIVRLLLRLAYSKVSEIELDPLLSLRVPPESVALFTRRLTVMLGAGISLHGAVNFLSDSEDDAMNDAAVRLLGAIETGHSLGNALSMMPGVFPSVFVGFARAGETSGRLVQALDCLATQMERTVMLRRRIMGALAYPFFLTSGALLLSLLLIFMIVPMMAPALQQLGVELPLLTRMLLRFTEVGAHPLVFLPVFLLLTTFTSGMVFTMSSTGRFTRARQHIDNLQLHTPLLARLSQQYASARVLSAAAMSVETGIPVTRALADASSLAANVIIESRILRTCDDIGQGVPLEQALLENGAFGPAETQVMICGSEAGDLARSMRLMAAHAEECLESTITSLTTLLEPIILAFMSLVVGTVSLATFLPWISLLQSIL